MSNKRYTDIFSNYIHKQSHMPLNRIHNGRTAETRIVTQNTSILISKQLQAEIRHVPQGSCQYIAITKSTTKDFEVHDLYTVALSSKHWLDKRQQSGSHSQ